MEEPLDLFAFGRLAVKPSFPLCFHHFLLNAVDDSQRYNQIVPLAPKSPA